jgi:hypothetical protein
MTILKNIKNWWLEKKLSLELNKNIKHFNKEVDENINMWSNKDRIDLIQDDQAIQQKYYSGLALVRQRLIEEMQNQDPEKVLERYKGEADFYMYRDILAMAVDEDKAKKSLREAKESVFVYKEADIKSDKDKINMIDDRISQYYELHDKKQERELMRKARQAYKEGDLELHATLMKQWEKDYGKHRNLKTRY